MGGGVGPSTPSGRQKKEGRKSRESQILYEKQIRDTLGKQDKAGSS